MSARVAPMPVESGSHQQKVFASDPHSKSSATDKIASVTAVSHKIGSQWRRKEQARSTNEKKFMITYKEELLDAAEKFDDVIRLIQKCGDQSLSKAEKDVLTSMLKSGAVKKASVFERIPIKLAVEKANKLLEEANDERQKKLTSIEQYTEGPDSYFKDAPDAVELVKEQLGTISWKQKEGKDEKDDLTADITHLQEWMESKGYSDEVLLRLIKNGEIPPKHLTKKYLPGVIIDEVYPVETHPKLWEFRINYLFEVEKAVIHLNKYEVGEAVFFRTAGNETPTKGIILMANGNQMNEETGELEQTYTVRREDSNKRAHDDYENVPEYLISEREVLRLEIRKWKHDTEHEAELLLERLGWITWHQREGSDARSKVRYELKSLERWMQSHEIYDEPLMKKLRMAQDPPRNMIRRSIHDLIIKGPEDFPKEEVKDGPGCFLFRREIYRTDVEEVTIEMDVHKVNQLYYLPEEITEFSLHTPHASKLRKDTKIADKKLLDDICTAFRTVNTSVDEYSGGKDADWHRVLMEGPTYVMVKYAEQKIQGAYEHFMRGIFGASFKAGPVKSSARILDKVKADLAESNPTLSETLKDAPNQEAWSHQALTLKSAHDRILLSTLCYNITDVVRGAVCCKNSKEMMKNIHKLKKNPANKHGKFIIKRIKNSHHPEAARYPGGYRDVKVIGAFFADETDNCMLVETQFIDRKILQVKKFMHRPYGIGRGDYGMMPVAVAMHRGHDCEFISRRDILTAVVLNGVSTVGEEAFRGCSALFDIEFSSSTKTIRPRAFMLCERLTTVHLNEGLDTIEEQAFFRCTKLNMVTFPTSLRHIESSFLGCSGLTEIHLNEGLEVIGAEAFKDCRNLKTFKIPKSVKHIGAHAFRDCKCLKYLAFPSSLETMGENAFAYCKGLETIEFDEQCELRIISKRSFFMCKGLRQVTGLPEKLTKIQSEAFAYCSQLGLCDLPPGVRTIEKWAFSFCKNLDAIKPPQEAEEIDRAAFRECSAVVSLPIAFKNKWMLRSPIQSLLGDGTTRPCTAPAQNIQIQGRRPDTAPL